MTKQNEQTGNDKAFSVALRSAEARGRVQGLREAADRAQRMVDENPLDANEQMDACHLAAVEIREWASRRADAIEQEQLL